MLWQWCPLSFVGFMTGEVGSVKLALNACSCVSHMVYLKLRVAHGLPHVTTQLDSFRLMLGL